jgi:hypothetical protein
MDLAGAYRCSSWAQATALPAREWSVIAAQCRAGGVTADLVNLASPAIFVAALIGAVLVPIFVAQRSKGAAAAAHATLSSGDGLVGAARESLRQSVRPAVLLAAAPIAIGVVYAQLLQRGAEAITALVLSAIAASVSFAPFGDRADAPPVPVKLLAAVGLALAPLLA